jgi:hypothetical protein
MTSPQPTPRRKTTGILQRIAPATWAGIGGTVLLGVIGLASGGIWFGILMVALVLLVTAVYGLALRRQTWLRLPRKRSTAAIGAGIALAVLLGSSSAYGAGHPVTPTSTPAAVAAATASAAARAHTPKAKPTHVPVITTKDVPQTSAIAFTATTVQDPSKPKGTTAITTAGVNGVDTKTFTVTYTDGTETARVLKSDVVTTAPVAQVTDVGTYVAPPPPPAAAPAPAPAPAPATNCTNGTYVDSAGATVCRPEVAAGPPAGATAKCGDGTYSFSQSRSGTCSSHGGVAAWL